MFEERSPALFQAGAQGMSATLAHVKSRFRLLASCDDCAQAVESDVAGLMAHLGSIVPVPAIELWLRCLRCGSCVLQLPPPDSV